jgi:hypothetical protein
MKHEAIYNLYPNVKMIEENHNGSITAYDENKNEVAIDMTLVNAKETELKAEIEQAEQDAETKKASGKQKLLDLGLTESEVKALIGI